MSFLETLCQIAELSDHMVNSDYAMDALQELISEISSPPAVGKQERGNTLDNIELGKRVFVAPFRHTTIDYPALRILDEAGVCKTNVEEIRKILRQMSDEHFTEYLNELDKTLRKDELIGNAFLKRSSSHYDQNAFNLALRCSNLGLMFMPAESPSVLKLHANRAATLYNLQEYKESLNDAEVSLALTKGSPSLIKQVHMLKRTSRELRKMKNDSNSAVKRSNIEKQLEYRKEKLYRVFGEQNVSLPSAGSYISIAENPSKGRTLVFTQDLNAGTTVIVEDPYVVAFTDALKFQTTHCLKCFKKIMSIVPCDECVFASYCSRKCRQDDRNLHKYECPCMNYFHAIQLSSTGHLAFRAVCRAGPEYMYKLFGQMKNGAPQDNNLPRGFNPETKIYESNDYFQINNLIYHEDGSSVEDHSWLAFSLANVLQIRTTFFHGISSENLGSFFNFVVSAIVQSLVSFPTNIFSLWADSTEPVQETENEVDLLEEEEPDYSNLLAVYSLCSLMSHSCDPSGIRFNSDYGKMAIVTSRCVKAGEELTISYGHEYGSCTKDVRQDKLEEDYYFKCDCVACLYDWPLRSALYFEPNYLCPECVPKTSYNDIITLHTTLLYNQHLQIGTCETCRRNYIMQDLKDEVDECFRRVEFTRYLIDLNNPLAALPIIIQCVEFLQRRVLPPAVQLYDAQELLFSALSAISASDPRKIQHDSPV